MKYNIKKTLFKINYANHLKIKFRLNICKIYPSLIILFELILIFF